MPACLVPVVHNIPEHDAMTPCSGIFTFGAGKAWRIPMSSSLVVGLIIPPLPPTLPHALPDPQPIPFSAYSIKVVHVHKGLLSTV